jgi:uncharacterized protein YecE (DUF72 family)
MAGLASKNVLVGAGGWQDYGRDKVPGYKRLTAYSREFDFVEVNSTFYRIIQPKKLELWRKSVPPNFEFSVKCYKALTHEVGLRPVEDTFRVFNLMRKYCQTLNAKILLMQTPPTLKLDDKYVNNARHFLIRSI